ncbi:MAG: AbrB/MazE/SpoVT family DNA-binding domain-containing protein [Bacilli bacterium]|nr:AbrB/MazE/SpoVT family DNA-binding domain-containing protein [Bacilli bacterium]
MKSTGVVRRIDDLGRIVIPKEIRRSLRIHDGESMEIFVDNELIALKKYSSLDELVNLSILLVDVIYNDIKKEVLITDMDKVIAYSGKDKKKYLSSCISQNLVQMINERMSIKISKKDVELIDGISYNSGFIIYPIIANGDACGSVVVLCGDTEINEEDERLVKFVADFLGKHIEQ